MMLINGTEVMTHCLGMLFLQQQKKTLDVVSTVNKNKEVVPLYNPLSFLPLPPSPFEMSSVLKTTLSLLHLKPLQ